MLPQVKGNKSRIINFAKYGLGLLVLAVAIYVFLRSPGGIAFAIETSGTEFGISTYPTSGFFQAANMFPGKRIRADLTVQNIGQYDFSYNIAVRKDSGDDLLFNKLLLVIEDEYGPLYQDNLSTLSKDLGVLVKGGTKVLKFRVELPSDSGNEYQGLITSVTFILNATEHPGKIIGEVVWDPPLEKPDVHTRQGEIMPISFHLVNDGRFDTVKRGVDLVITGIYEGISVQYMFSVPEGTLSWDGSLQKPHYQLHFDTGQYPVDPDTYYTATVIYGDEPLGTTRFKSGQVNNALK